MVHAVQIWLHTLRICGISKRNILIRNEAREDNITKLNRGKKITAETSTEGEQGKIEME
jgi:hypothetical protein